MIPKTIIVPYGGHNYEQATLETAFHIGQRFGAHVEVWHVVSDPFDIIESYSAFTAMPDNRQSSLSAYAKDAREAEKNARKKFSDVVSKFESKQKANKSGDMDEASFSFHTAFGFLDQIISARGRTADLIVMCRPKKDVDAFFAEMVATIIYGSERPVLLLPKGLKVSDLDGDALIAWNGSVEAGKATLFALPFLSGRTWIVSSQAKGPSQKATPSAEDLVVYLRRHKINAETLLHNVKNTDAPKTILDKASRLRVSLIVMGVYGHNRLSEMILGGVTDYMLRHANVPLLLAH